MRRYYTLDTIRQKYEWKEQKLAGKVMHDRWFKHVEKIISLTYLRPFTLTPCNYDSRIPYAIDKMLRWGYASISFSHQKETLFD